MNQPISSDQVSFRRRELKWIKFFKNFEIILTVTCILNYLSMCFLFGWDFNKSLFSYTVAFQSDIIYLFLILGLIFLAILIYKMFKLHRQEFLRVRFNLIMELLFFCVLLS